MRNYFRVPKTVIRCPVFFRQALTYPVNNQPGLTDAEDAEDMSSALELEPTSKV